MLFEHQYLKNKFYKTTVIDALYFFSVFLYISFLSPYLSSLGWEESLKGWYFSLFALFGIFLSPAVGALSDSIGRYKVIVIGLALEVVSLAVYALSTDVYVLFGLRILSAISFNMVTLTALSRIHDTVSDDKNRSKVAGLFHSVLAIAALSAPLLGGFIADVYGFQFLFIVAALFIAALFFGMIIYDLFWYRDDYPHREKQPFRIRDMNPLLDAKDLFRFKEFKAISIVGMLVNFSAPMMTMVLPFLVTQQFGLSNQHLSVVVFLFGFAHLFQYYLGIYTDKIGKLKAVYQSLTLLAISFLLFFFIGSYYVLLVFVVLSSLISALWNISAWSYMSDLGEKHNMEGKLVGVYSSVTRIPKSISFILTGFILSYSVGLIVPFYGILIIIGLLSQRRILFKKTVQSE